MEGSLQYRGSTTMHNYLILLKQYVNQEGGNHTLRVCKEKRWQKNF